MLRRGIACALGTLLLVGLAASPAFADPPDAPAQPTVTVGNGQIVVTYAQPADNGSTITSYTATCTSSDGGATNFNSYTTPDETVQPITVTGLTNGNDYTCTVTATNGDGMGTSPPSNSVLVGQIPDPPVTPGVTPGDGQIMVSFTPPNLYGSPLVEYGAVCLSSGNPVAFGSGLTSPIAATGAANGQSYTCQVHAQTQFGIGNSSPSSAAVIPAGVPGYPANPTITPGNNVMQVAFTPPADNGSAITSYLATCTSTDGGAAGTATGTASPINVTGLTNGNTYTCDVSAFNSAGQGGTSGESPPAVANGVPDAPAKPTVTGGPSRVIVSFVLPPDNGNEIFKTAAACTSSNGGAPGSKVSEPTDAGETFSPIVVTGLTNGKSYSCHVTATNDVGTSPSSPVSSAAIPRTPPGAPTGVRAVSGVATGTVGPIVVSFGAGAANGSAITSFRATCTDLKTALTYSKSGANSPLAVGALTAGHPFSCAVVDISAGGTSVSSAVAKVTVGTPGQALFARIAQKNQGVTLTMLSPAANGRPITKYVASCTSTNGGVTRGSASTGSVIVVTKLTIGHLYTCSVTVYNARGAGTPVKSGAFTVNK